VRARRHRDVGGPHIVRALTGKERERIIDIDRAAGTVMWR
jgi:hypothetical protein